MEEDTNSINLLDLPNLALEGIFLNCQNNLKTLTECNKFMKHMMETNFQLRQYLVLNIKIPYGTLEPEDKDIMKACMESTRKYESLKIIHDYERFVFDEEDVGLNVKALVDKHAATTKEVEIFSNASGIYSVFKVLKYLENLVNANDISLVLEENIDEDYLQVSEASFPNNNFNQLKSLWLDVCSSIAFSLFKNCKKLEFFGLIISCGIDINFSNVYLALKNSRDNLQEFRFESCSINEKEIGEFLKELMKCELNLKIFMFTVANLDSLISFENPINTHRLMDFLKSQKNLEEFTFDSFIGWRSVDAFREGWVDLTKYKKLGLSFHSCSYGSNYNDYNNVLNDTSGLHETLILFHTSSQSMQSLKIKGVNFQGIPQNYQNLVTLKVGPYCFHTSNDIFLILKYLKKLENLDFHFPKDSPMNSELFESMGDLQLPKLKEVAFFINQLITEEIFQKILDLVNNTTDFRLVFYYDFYSKYPAYMVIAVKTLRKLINSTLILHITHLDEFDRLVLEQIEKNVQQFNRAPQLFRINSNTLDHWKSLAPVPQANGEEMEGEDEANGEEVERADQINREEMEVVEEAN